LFGGFGVALVVSFFIDFGGSNQLGGVFIGVLMCKGFPVGLYDAFCYVVSA